MSDSEDKLIKKISSLIPVSPLYILHQNYPSTLILYNEYKYLIFAQSSTITNWTYCPEIKSIICTCSNGEISILNINLSSKSLTTPFDSIDELCVSPNGQYFSITNKSNVFISSLELNQSKKFALNTDITRIFFTEDSNRIVIVDNSNWVRIYSVKSIMNNKFNIEFQLHIPDLHPTLPINQEELVLLFVSGSYLIKWNYLEDQITKQILTTNPVKFSSDKNYFFIQTSSDTLVYSSLTKKFLMKIPSIQLDLITIPHPFPTLSFIKNLIESNPNDFSPLLAFNNFSHQIMTTRYDSSIPMIRTHGVISHILSHANSHIIHHIISHYDNPYMKDADGWTLWTFIRNFYKKN